MARASTVVEVEVEVKVEVEVEVVEGVERLLLQYTSDFSLFPIFSAHDSQRHQFTITIYLLVRCKSK